MKYRRLATMLGGLAGAGIVGYSGLSFFSVTSALILGLGLGLVGAHLDHKFSK